MRPEEHPLYTQNRPISNKEAAISITSGFILLFVGFIYFMGKGTAW